MNMNIVNGTRMFFNNKYKIDAQSIQDTEIFQQLKPKLQRQVLDKIFLQFYKLFDVIFEDCESSFVRKIIQTAKFNY